ncbi:hypothetical protein OG21DRAFT_1510585 [Imleria badia]|nr:hypothetical protein OG21DRAFT_1510585 [Imleria badia]
MTRARKLTLSVKEFSHLVSESLDIAHATPCPQSFVDNPAFVFETPRKIHSRPSASFQRIFSRPTPTPGQHVDSLQGPPASEDLSETPRKMIGWPFSRSPRKNRPTKDEGNPTEAHADPEGYHSTGMSPYSVSSPAAASTSSLGSLVPAHECLFQVESRDSEELSQNGHVFKVASSSPVTIVPPHASDPPTASGCYATATRLEDIFGNGSATSVSCSIVEAASRISSQGSLIRASLEAEASDSVASNSERPSIDDDPTPRAATFDPRATLPLAATQDEPVLAQRGRPQHLSLIVPSRNVDILAFRPAVGVAPHAPSESSVSACSTSSLTSIAQASSPTFPTTRPDSEASPPRVPPFTPSNARFSAISPSIASPSNLESVLPLGVSPRTRKRAMSRSQTPPPLPLPPPTGPLPAVPSSVPPVPPLPPLLSKISMNTSPHAVISSPPRSTLAGASTNPATALPPSPPGGLRLPSRLSWVNNVRAVLPSPPASPTKSLKSLADKTLPTPSPSKTEMKRPNELKRPTSIGVIEAADNVQVRRTKSILLLGSRSKSNASLGTKRVQIHADVNVDANTTRKARRKSSAATVGHPPFSSDCGSVIIASSELLVPRERRHSAPVLSSMDSKPSRASADWTLSLPFCTDVPGNKILPSPLLTPQLKSEHGLEEVQGEDWTLCMPLKVRVGTPTAESAEGTDSECTFTGTAETVEAQPAMQLPTPCPSPTWSTPASAVLPLDPEEDIPQPEDRPASPASLGPHVGGLDLAGGHGKRASGWHVYGWFDEVDVTEEEEDCELVTPTASAISESQLVKSHVAVFRKTHDLNGRHPSQESMSTVSTSESMFYSARSSLLVN